MSPVQSTLVSQMLPMIAFFAANFSISFCKRSPALRQHTGWVFASHSNTLFRILHFDSNPWAHFAFKEIHSRVATRLQSARSHFRCKRTLFRGSAGDNLQPTAASDVPSGSGGEKCRIPDALPYANSTNKAIKVGTDVGSLTEFVHAVR